MTTDSYRREPHFRAVPMTLFPTFETLDQAFNYSLSRLPINNRNDLLGVLMTYHNTLLAQHQREQRNQPSNQTFG